MLSEKEAKKVMDWAKTEMGWPLIINMIKQYPGVLTLRDAKQGASLMHWAALGFLNGLQELVSRGMSLTVMDNSGRTPLEWAIEKLYFMREEAMQNPEKRTGMWRSGELQAEACALQLLSWGAPLVTENEKKGSYSLRLLIAQSGSLSLLAEVKDNPEWTALELHTFLIGWWVSRDEFKKALTLMRNHPHFETLKTKALELNKSKELSDERLEDVLLIANAKTQDI